MLIVFAAVYDLFLKKKLRVNCRCRYRESLHQYSDITNIAQAKQVPELSFIDVIRSRVSRRDIRDCSRKRGVPENIEPATKIF